MSTDSEPKSSLQLVCSLGRFRNWVLPVGVMRELIRRGADATPVIRQRLELALESEGQGIEAGYPEAFFCYHLLGIDPDPSLTDWFGRFLRSDLKKIDALAGEITNSFTRALLAAIADREDLPAFCRWVDSLLQDDQVYIYAKLNAVSALFNLVGEGSLDASVAVGWVRTWLEQRKAVAQDEWSSMIVAEVMNVGGKDLKELALECFSRNQIDEGYVGNDSLQGMSDDLQADFLRDRASSDRAILVDPVDYLEPWHSFAWTTDSSDPQSATYSRIPVTAEPFSSKPPGKAEIEQWLAEIDKSNFETYPKSAIQSLNRHAELVIEPLVERVRHGIEATKQGESIASNGPYLAATLLAHNSGQRNVLFQDSELFLEILDLTSEQRFEWFGDSIDSHLVEALAHTLVGQSEPIFQRILETHRTDVERVDLIAFFPLSVYEGYLSREECIDVLQSVWEILDRREQNGEALTLLPRQVIADATGLLAMPEDDPLVRSIHESEVGYFGLSQELVDDCRSSPTKAREIMRRLVLARLSVEEVIEQSCQFDSDAINARPKHVPQLISPLIAPPTPAQQVTTIRNESPRVGRNDPCPCGSGKKFKKCCGRNK